MKSKKTMLILPVVAVALCAVALIGAGFAANYTGTTANTGNEVKSYYISVTPEYAADAEKSFKDVFDTEICYDSLTVKEGTKYRLNAIHNSKITPWTDEQQNEKRLLILDSITLKINQPGNDKNNFVLNVAVDDTDKLATGKFYMGIKLGDSNDEDIDPYNGNYSTDPDDSIESTISKIVITLYYDVTDYTYDGEDEGSEYDYTGGEPNHNPAGNVTFTFTATATNPRVN